MPVLRYSLLPLRRRRALRARGRELSHLQNRRRRSVQDTGEEHRTERREPHFPRRSQADRPCRTLDRMAQCVIRKIM